MAPLRSSRAGAVGLRDRRNPARDRDRTWRLHAPLPLAYLALAVQGATLTTFFAFGEEYGWRGYLLPRLLPLGEVKAAVIVGLIWGPWHAPLLVAGLNYSNVNPWAAIAIFVPVGIFISLFATRLYVAAGASVLTVAVLHGSLNAFSEGLADGDHLSGNPLVVSPGGAIGIAVMALIAIGLYGLRRHRSGARQLHDEPVNAALSDATVATFIDAVAHEHA